VKRSYRFLSALSLSALAGLFLTGCQDVFTTSLAQSLARANVTVKVSSTAEALSVAEQALDSGDSGAAESALEGIMDYGVDISNAELVAAVAQLAISSTNISSTVLDAVAAVSSGGSLDAESLLTSLESLDISDAAVAALLLLDDSGADTSGLSATDYVLASAVLLLAAQDGTVAYDASLQTTLTTYLTAAQTLAAEDTSGTTTSLLSDFEAGDLSTLAGYLGL
jgi:hypothetical protein